LAQRVADLYLKNAPQPAPASPATALQIDDKPEVAVDAKRLDAYVGDYELRPGFVLSIVRAGNHLVVRPTGQPPAPMYAVSDTAFRVRIAPIEVDFDSPVGPGQAQGAVYHQNGATIPMKRIELPRLSAEQLKAYEGKFYSPELDVTYEVSVRDSGLRVHFAGGEVNLDPLGKDLFASAGGTATFTCGGGACTGFSMDDGRALSLRFTRVAATIAGAKLGD
jgi:hypothetical protein